MKRLVCYCIGHKYKIYASSYRAMILACYSPIAGCCVECERCGDKYCGIPDNATRSDGTTHDCERDKLAKNHV